MDMNELFARALKTDPAQIGHYVQGGFMDASIKPISEDIKMIGPAFTVRLPGNDNAMLYYAMKRAPKGSVVVIDRMGDKRVAAVGEMVVQAARSLGLAGIIDGVIVAPADRFAELVDKAEAADRGEVEWRKCFAEGKYLDALMNLDRLVEEGAKGKIAELMKLD